MNWDMDSEQFQDMDEDEFAKELNKLSPNDFYFQLVTGNFLYGNHYFAITPKPYFDTNQCLLDEEVSQASAIPNGFEEIGNSIFVYHGSTYQSGRNTLLNAGFIEKNLNA